jgi:hypothetical protein
MQLCLMYRHDATLGHELHAITTMVEIELEIAAGVDP